MYRGENQPLCRAYLRFTDHIICSYKKRHKLVSTSTINRWCKTILGKAGIDIEKYSSHPTRSDSLSKAKSRGLSSSKINKAASWKETSAYRRFYDKPIYRTFGELVIQ